MRLSIITVNYKSWGHLEAALSALSEGFPEDWEIIVVDNESDPAEFDAFAATIPMGDVYSQSGQQRLRLWLQYRCRESEWRATTVHEPGCRRDTT